VSVKNDLHITRLLLNPMGEPAPDGERGDMIRISDGTSTMYMDPADFEASDDRTIRYLLASQGGNRG
jgi:hypothetical protein